MRVLAVTHVFPRAEDDPSAPFLLTWARALRAAGADVAVIAPHDAGLPKRHRVGGVPVLRARYASDNRERLAYRGEMHQIALTPTGPALVARLLGAMARDIRVQVRRGRPDVLHVHWWMPGALAVRLARVEAPVVCTVHGTDVTLIEQRPALAPLARWALERVDRVEAVSTDLADRLERATGRAADALNPMPLDQAPQPVPEVSPPAETAVAAEGHDQPGDGGVPQPASARLDGPLRLLAVGRMVPEKGFAELVSAAALLEGPVRLMIVGDGPEQDRLASQAGALGVDLTLRGRLPRAELWRAYAETDIVVQPSHREGLGLVAAEALIAGVPVVAADSGGARDVLDLAHLVPAGDADALAKRIAAVAGDLHAERAAAIARGDQLRARLSPESAARRTLDGYRAIVR